MMTIRRLVLSIAALGVAVPVAAQEMRCGNELIAGDQIHPLLMPQVLEKCGEPTERDGDRWFYQEQGKILVFNGSGELDHIEDANEND